MRIGITCYPTYGGSGVVATELGIELAARGHEVHFISYSQPFRLSGRDNGILYHEVPVSSYPLFEFPPYDLALASRMAEVAEFYKLDLLHVHYAIPHSVSALLARQMLATRGIRLPFVTTLHGTDITLVGSHPSFYRATRYGMESSCAVTAVSNWLSEETMHEFHLTRPVKTIYNFIDLEKFQPRPVNRAALAKDDEKIVMHISNFRPVKRVTDVVRAFRKMLDQVNARLIMMGDGPERIGAMGVLLAVTFLIAESGGGENCARKAAKALSES